MLVAKMNNKELHKEIMNDYYYIKDSIHEQLIIEKYDKLRKKNKIHKSEIYAKTFEIDTPLKNKWFLVVNKAHSDIRYKYPRPVGIFFLTYYYNDIGLRVFKIKPDNNGRNATELAVYNGHFFKRYNERMNLNLINPLDRVKHYFENNGIVHSRVVDTKYLVLEGKTKNGYVFGQIENDGKWFVYKTFISNDMMKKHQSSLSEELEHSLLNQITQEISTEGFDRVKYNYLSDVFKSIY